MSACSCAHASMCKVQVERQISQRYVCRPWHEIAPLTFVVGWCREPAGRPVHLVVLRPVRALPGVAPFPVCT